MTITVTREIKINVVDLIILFSWTREMGAVAGAGETTFVSFSFVVSDRVNHNNI